MLGVILLRLVLFIAERHLSVFARVATELGEQFVFVIQQAAHHSDAVRLTLDDLTFAWGWFALGVFRFGRGLILMLVLTFHW